MKSKKEHLNLRSIRSFGDRKRSIRIKFPPIMFFSNKKGNVKIDEVIKDPFSLLKEFKQG
jgi:hypothetical protein